MLVLSFPHWEISAIEVVICSAMATHTWALVPACTQTHITTFRQSRNNLQTTWTLHLWIRHTWVAACQGKGHWDQMWRTAKNSVRNHIRQKSNDKDKHFPLRTFIARCAEFRIGDNHTVYHSVRPTHGSGPFPVNFDLFLSLSLFL